MQITTSSAVFRLQKLKEAAAILEGFEPNIYLGNNRREFLLRLGVLLATISEISNLVERDDAVRQLDKQFGEGGDEGPVFK
tara:strand:+ start:531 stop:773 length:243 start_codon:yes stop_codon:yes gene_type:complete